MESFWPAVISELDLEKETMDRVSSGKSGAGGGVDGVSGVDGAEGVDEVSGVDDVEPDEFEVSPLKVVLV